MGENICKLFFQQGISVQNKQKFNSEAVTIQLKIDKCSEQTCLKKRTPKYLTSIWKNIHQHGNVDQTHEMPLYS